MIKGDALEEDKIIEVFYNKELNTCLGVISNSKVFFDSTVNYTKIIGKFYIEDIISGGMRASIDNHMLWSYCEEGNLKEDKKLKTCAENTYENEELDKANFNTKLKELKGENN